MPALPLPSIRSVVERPGLGLVVRIGDVRTRGGADRPVRWVAVSELEDPRSFLEGGELVLTTGMRLADDDGPAWDAYVGRLIEADVAALGLGVGLTHETVPESLLAAAAARGLVVIEVPAETPFIAVTKAVSSMVAAQEYEATTRAFEIQRDLTRASLGADPVRSVTARLSRALAAWALVLDPGGHVLAASPEGAADRLEDLGQQLDLLRPRGLLSSSSFDMDADRVVLHPLGARGMVRGFLAAGRVGGFDRTDQSLVAVAVSLLSLALERGEADGSSEDRVRSAALRLLVSGSEPDLVLLEMLGWTWLTASTLRVVRIPRAATEDRPVAELFGSSSRDLAFAVLGDEAVLLFPDHPDDRRVVAEALSGRAAGGSGPVGLPDLAAAWKTAGETLAAARGGVVWHDDLGAAGFLGVIDPVAGRAFADSLLAPLDATEGKADLLASTRAWLAHHGQWDVAARELGVHRHTLRYRMRRVEELLGRTLDDPDLRADLWVALELRRERGPSPHPSW